MAPSTLWSALFSRIQRTSVSTATVSGDPGSENFRVIRSPILRIALVGDEDTAGADVLREPGVEVVIALEIDLHLEVEPLRGPNILLVLRHFGPRAGVH